MVLSQNVGAGGWFIFLMVNIYAMGARYLYLCSRRIPTNESGYPWELVRAPSPSDRVRNTDVHWLFFCLDTMKATPFLSPHSLHKQVIKHTFRS